MTDKTTQPEDAIESAGSELTRLLAVATTAHGDFDADCESIIITIGKGMFWSKEFDMEARALAEKIEAEFERIASAGN